MGTGKVSTWYRLTVPRFFPLLSLDLPLGNTLSRIAPANNLYFDYEALEISRNYIPWHEFVFLVCFVRSRDVVQFRRSQKCGLHLGPGDERLSLGAICGAVNARAATEMEGR